MPYEIRDDDLLMGHGPDEKPAGKRLPLFTAAFWTRRRAILAVVLLGLFLRLWSAWQLPLDADEPVYLGNANAYAQAILDGDGSTILNYSGNSEHPPLMKLMYALVVAGLRNSLGGNATLDLALFFTRLVSVVFGTLAVWVVALINPIAGVFLAIHTYAVKYTSETYLEALPLFASVLTVYALLRTKPGGDRWFWVSAAALGLTAAGKYSYFPILFVALYILVAQKRYSWKKILPYFALAAVTFFSLNPYLWPDPVGRLADSLFFHVGYSQGQHVQEVGYPWYQPFLWLMVSYPYAWHPDVFFYFGFEGPFFVLAIANLQEEWRERRWLVVWIVTALLVLLIWPTKWPQYTLALAPAICLAAAASVQRIYRWSSEMENTWGWFSAMIPRPTLAVKVMAGLFVVVLLGSAVVYAAAVTLNRAGWSNMRSLNSGLTSDTVYDIQPLPDGRIVLATANGVAVYHPPAEKELLPGWETFTRHNSSLPGNRVTCVLLDDQDALWFGTDGGVAVLDGQSWKVYPSDLAGLPGAQVMALAEGSDGRIWAATSAGAAVFDGASWQAFSPQNASDGEGTEYFLSVAVVPAPQGDQVFFGATNSLYRFDPDSEAWEQVLPASLRRGGIAHLLVASDGRLWVSTLGSGVWIWDGAAWTTMDVTNSDLPYNTVQEVYEVEPGKFWIATGMPVGVGGVLARYDGSDWDFFTSQMTGYSGSEALSIARDAQGRFWFGTYTAGVDIYDPSRLIFSQY